MLITTTLQSGIPKKRKKIQKITLIHLKSGKTNGGRDVDFKYSIKLIQLFYDFITIYSASQAS